MRDPEDCKDDKPRNPALDRRIVLARLILAWEVIWPAIWPVLGLAGLFAGIALLDGFAILPGWFHTLVLVLTIGVFGYAVWRAAQVMFWPSRRDAVRRIQTASGFEHRPLEAVRDTLPGEYADPQSRALWQAHQRQMMERIRAIKVDAPSPGLPARDPWALRAAVVLLVFVGITVSGAEAPERLGRAFVPEFGVGASSQTAKLEIWMTPPGYTRLPPVFPMQITRDHARSLESVVETAKADGTEAPAAAPLEIEVPAGSQLTAIVSGGKGDAVLDVDGVKAPFETLDKVNRRLQQAVAASGRLSVIHNGKTIGSWRIRVREDARPAIAFDGAPSAIKRGTLRIAYKGGDDYGIVTLRAEMRRTYERGQVTGKETSTFNLPAPSLNASAIKEATFHEIAAHPWAGLPVTIRLIATDAAEQDGFSEEINIVLPERNFLNPVARKIIAERRKLTTQPERRSEIIDELNDIAGKPSEYKDDTVVLLGLVTSRSRLVYEKDDAAIPSVRKLLWDTALRVEDGQLSHTERELLRAQEALMKALARNASDRELEKLIHDLQQAMNRFMRELAKKVEQEKGTDQAMPFDPNAQMLQSSDLQRMMEQIRQMIRAGARDAARQMLSQLRNLLENLSNAWVMRANPNAQRGDKALRQLQEMIRRQSELMDKTFRQSRGRHPGPNQMQQGAQQQGALRKMLQKFREMMGGMMTGNSLGLRSLGQAGRAMEDAQNALGQGSPGQAVGPQGRAIEALQRAGRGIMHQMMRGQGRGTGIGMGEFRNQLRGMRDPLGRNWLDEDGGGADIRSFKIPDRGSIERAHEILRELRERAGQRYRAVPELEYIDRLLNRF
jgi:uncharacterized protein (TIGR02302 family)